MPGYSLVPVDYQPDFDNYSLVPVDHDPFAADDTIQRARTQQKSQPQPLANGTGQPNVGAPANNAQAAVADASYNPNSVSGGGSYGGGMADYSLIPVDYQPDFGDYSLVPVDYDPFIADDIIQRTRTQLASQPQPDAGFDQPPSAPQTPGSAPPLSPIVPNDGQAPSVPQPPGQDLHSQYQALRPMLGDRNAMLATAYPEVRQTLIAQRRDSTAADTDSTGAATAATACDGSRSARRQRAGDWQQLQRIGWRRWRQALWRRRRRPLSEPQCRDRFRERGPRMVCCSQGNERPWCPILPGRG